ncbi:MAG TPA: PIG-L family deacetylase [Candidatus Hydrogenedens sp.]|nr:PIG-L family deacetylase [Candidatus Hydrogenedens sp.]
MKNVLVVVAHGDDMEFMCAGTIYRLVEEKKYNVYELILTDNRKGTFSLSEGEVVEKSRLEAIEAGKVLGLKEVRFGNFLDSELEDVPRKYVRNMIIDVIREVKANIVFSWDPFAPGEDHPDHRYTAMVTYEACSFSSNPKFGTVGLYQPHFVSEAYWFAKKPYSVNAYIDISAVIDKKIESLLKHETQMDLTIDSLLLEASTLGINMDGLKKADRELKNQVITSAIKNYTAEKGRSQGIGHAELFRYEKFGVLELVLGEEIVKPDFPLLTT